MSLAPRVARFLYAHRRPILLAVGVCSLALAAAVLLVPGAVVVLGGGVRAMVVLAGLAAGLIGMWTVVRMTDDGPVPRRPGPFDRVPEHVEVGVDAVVGDGVNETLDRYTAQRRWREQRTARVVREQLGDAVIETIVDTEGVDRETAVARLSDGSWTDDELAAELFAEPGTIERSLDERIAEWVRGDPFARRVEATVDELGRRHEARRRTPLESLDGMRREPRTSSVRIVSADGEER